MNRGSRVVLCFGLASRIEANRLRDLMNEQDPGIDAIVDVEIEGWWHLFVRPSKQRLASMLYEVWRARHCFDFEERLATEAP